MGRADPQVALTLGLTLVAAVVVISNAQVYQLTAGFSYAGAPYATVTARSRIQCSLRCAAIQIPACGGTHVETCDGFQFLPDGTCHLYAGYESVCSASGEPVTEQPTTTLSVQPPTYRKRRDNTDNTTDPCASSCPDGFTSCCGRCYHATLTGYTYTGAVQYCSDMGGILATPRSSAENTCAKDVAYAVSGGNSFWIGYRGGTTATSFAGADGGGAMSFTNWRTAAGEPHLDVADNCVRLWTGAGLWDDYPCTYSRSVLCQAHN